MKKVRIIALTLALAMLLCLAACGKKEDAGKKDSSEPKILKIAESFAYPSLDAHRDYYGWYTSIYGITETLFRVADDLSIKPLLAESSSVSDDGRTWSFAINGSAKFSNGSAVTADMVQRNLKRLAQENERFAYLNDFVIEAKDAGVLTITTPEIYPTMLTDLTAPETAILDLDATKDFDKAPVGTGPFVIKSFEPEGTVEVEKNPDYWNGEVRLDGAIFYYMQDDESKLMAMQSGDIDGYTSVTAAAKEIYEKDPDTYTLTQIPATRLQFYCLNENTLSDNVRAAINLTTDCEAIARYLGGTVTAATGPFSVSAPYGKVTKPSPDAAAAAGLLEADGYKKNASGIWEKNGKPLEINICYYAARSLDSIALLMQEQLKAAGIASRLTVQEDPDSTYIASGDFDIALYCMIADKAGDPYYCIDALFRADSRWAIGGFENNECEKMIDSLRYETDTAKRAELANKIVQLVIDDNAFGFVGLFNKTTVTRKGVSGIAEKCPFDFYGVDAATDIA